MSRFRGPRVKVNRALGVDLPGLTRKSRERRPYPPGPHNQIRRKLTEYGMRLVEKQKLRMDYGLTERQLSSLMREARAGAGNSGQRLMRFLECRLDNVVFRGGFARTIPGARQLVNHGHFRVNGRKVDIPSYRVHPGDVISVRERSHKLAPIVAALGEQLPFDTPWLEVDKEGMTVKLAREPDHDPVPFPISIQLVIEYYSKRM